MTFRTATIEDIAGMQKVRLAVTENVLSNPALVTPEHYKEYLFDRGKGWVCDHGGICGFAIADLKEKNIWALFVLPEYEKKGIGKHLHQIMMDWYFQHHDWVWLSTTPGTRAAHFYKRAGWWETGPYGADEIKLELTKAEWLNRNQENSTG